MAEGLLIVNADDWGYDEHTTAAIADCHAAGALTSTTAMVFMAGSEAAAERAAELPGLAIGLHLNLDEAYSGAEVPAATRERQRRLLPHYRRGKLRRWLFDPRLCRATDRVIADQVERFQALYGRPPTHIDGHHHAHLAANVLLSPALPRGIALRRPLSDIEQRAAASRALRRGRDRLLLRGHPSTDRFYDLRRIWPSLGGGPAEPFLAASDRASVEIMAHPGLPDEHEALLSPQWLAAIASRPLDSFAQLP